MRLVLIPLVLILASAAMSVRNVHAHWGSWEPLKRLIKPNPLRPIVYFPRHNTIAQRKNPCARRAADLITEMYHWRVFNNNLAPAAESLSVARHALAMA